MAKTIAPHTFVLFRKPGGYGLSLGDPTKTSSTLKRVFSTKQELKDWVRDEVGHSVSADHVVDATGLGLVPKEHSAFYAEVSKPSASHGPYRAATAADEAWGSELRRQFGKRAGDVRYTTRGKGEPGSELRRLHDAKLAADTELRSHYDARLEVISSTKPAMPPGTHRG